MVFKYIKNNISTFELIKGFNKFSKRSIMTSYVILGLGSNLGDRESYLNNAIGLIGKTIGFISEQSGIYETEPWGFQSEDNFLNMVLKVHTELKPFELLKKIQVIEDKLGRVRNNKQYASRTIDIDILFYANQVINKPGLAIPHPLIQDRRFVLVPLCDIAPKMIHPVLSKTFEDLLRICRDERIVRKVLSAG
jgi:2-amino-4-hydroxy-6-hydroxymethyldihydropteridine diphosphokinase